LCFDPKEALLIVNKTQRGWSPTD